MEKQKHRLLRWRLEICTNYRVKKRQLLWSIAKGYMALSKIFFLTLKIQCYKWFKMTISSRNLKSVCYGLNHNISFIKDNFPQVFIIKSRLMWIYSLKIMAWKLNTQKLGGCTIVRVNTGLGFNPWASKFDSWIPHWHQ